MNQERLDARRKAVALQVRLQQLEAQRAALHVELRDRVMYDYLAEICEGYRQGSLSNRQFYWSKTKPDFWPQYPKVLTGNIEITAYAWMDRSSQDAHRKYFRVLEGGLILVGPGWVMPDEYADIVKLLDERQAENLSTLLRIGQAVVRRDGPSDGPILPPYDAVELKQITTAFLHGY